MWSWTPAWFWWKWSHWNSNKSHPSIANINKNITKTLTFSFYEIETDLIKKMIDNLHSRKSGTFGGVPANYLKGVSDILDKFLHTAWNDEILKDLKFPIELKPANAVSAFKKEESTLVGNYIQTNQSFANYLLDFWENYA